MILIVESGVDRATDFVGVVDGVTTHGDHYALFALEFLPFLVVDGEQHDHRDLVRDIGLDPPEISHYRHHDYPESDATLLHVDDCDNARGRVVHPHHALVIDFAHGDDDPLGRSI